MKTIIPEIGDPWSWTPSAFAQYKEAPLDAFKGAGHVNGRVIYVNREHGWFRAEASFPGGTIRECFHFCTLGES